MVKCNICDPSLWKLFLSLQRKAAWLYTVQNVSRCVHTHVQTIISRWHTQRASVGFLTDEQLLSSGETETWHLKVSGPTECYVFTVLHNILHIFFHLFIQKAKSKNDLDKENQSQSIHMNFRVFSSPFLQLKSTSLLLLDVMCVCKWLQVCVCVFLNCV